MPIAPHLPKRSLPLLFAGAVLLLGSACSRTPHHQAVIRHAAAQSDQALAVQHLNQLYGSRLASDPGSDGERRTRRHALLWTMDRGILAVLGGRYQEAFDLLAEASSLVEEFRTRWTAGGITRRFTAAAINETIENYEGNAYEHIQVEFWRSLNELLQAQVQSGLMGSVEQLNRAAAHQHYQNAISFARRMVLNQIRESQDAADSAFWRRTYYDDPFARLYSAALMLAVPRDQRAGSDLQFADVMLKQAWEVYAAERGAMAGQRAYRYEVVPREQNQALITLMHRVGNAYDASGWASWATANGVPPPMPIRLGAEDAEMSAALPRGHGMLLVLHLADYISHPEALDIVAATGTVPITYTRARHGRDETATFRIGAVRMFARGPGAPIVNEWPILPLPPQITDALAPGGLAFIGTSIPVHAPDRAISPPPHAGVQSPDQGSLKVPLQVLADLDAYARATLKDEQPRILIRALARTAVKQLAAVLAAREAQKQAGPLAGFAVGLLGSGLATWSEVADVRGALLLPNTIQGSLIDLPTGRHHLRLNGAQGSIDLGEVTIPSGQLVVVIARGFPNPPPAPSK
ncbi:MAG: hypothetical protein EA402_10115 [Planctomycetota bacterium]|nr:MAG: hypothetical protein EA402_10115 [Planctomycetota bacterium]